MIRQLSISALSCAALWLCSPAFALEGYDDVAGAVCEAVPSDASLELRDAYAGRDTSGLDEMACKRLCHFVRKACEERAMNISDCHADMNKRQAKVEEVLCEGDDCAKDVKRARKGDDRSAKQAAKSTRRDCRDLEVECRDTCGAGTLFPSSEN